MKANVTPSSYWHTTPLHYAPYLLMTGQIFSQRQLQSLSLPITPRRTAARRDRKLGLDNFVHLSLTSVTPLLRDKLRKGYPHVLLAFDPVVFDLPGAAFCRYNAKSWGHRERFIPVTDPAEKAEILTAHANGRYPSLELILPERLPLFPYARCLYVASQKDADFLYSLHSLLPVPGISLKVSAEHFPQTCEYNRSPLEQYASSCRTAGVILAPPALPFD
jgi:hypothetical protein